MPSTPEEIDEALQDLFGAAVKLGDALVDPRLVDVDRQELVGKLCGGLEGGGFRYMLSSDDGYLLTQAAQTIVEIRGRLMI